MEMIKSKNFKNTYMLGVFALLTSAILTSFSQVFYANKVQSVNPFLFTGISFFITSIYFQIFVIGKNRKYHWEISWRPLLKLNISSILAFMGFYYALKYIEPAIVSSLEMGLGPLLIILIAVIQREKTRKARWFIAIGTLLACILVIGAVFTGRSAVNIEFNIQVVIGVIASIICGLGAVLCTIYSKQLSTTGWTSSMILSKRFIGIILLSFIFTYDLIFPYLLENIVWILVVTIAGVLLPMYLLQKGIQYCESFLVMMSLCFVPVFTFFIQLLDPRLEWSMLTFLGVLLLLVFGIGSIFIERRKE
ncbi:DMT family transporter [Viridibacillus sp. YIM B01967]|uniref:DMT family transporter n=2 Tax=Viridibacillus soli TaxID=2798301 RepID=A0ABS1H796_9BACL|nr:DMT family transporter [Viridibacillus soli]